MLISGNTENNESNIAEKRPFVSENISGEGSDAKKIKTSDSDANEEDESSNASDSEEEEFDLEASKLYGIMSDTRFSDLILVASKNVEFKSHRNILGYSSKTFANIFNESSEIPVRISVEDFEAEIVEAGLHFLYGKSDAIDDKEKEVYKFAEKFEIEDLKKACNIPPKKANSSFFHWMACNRESLKKPGMSIAEVALKAGMEWKKLTDKSKWEKIAEEDNLRFEEDMKLYLSRK